MYRIIQEALTNIARHAKADNISIVLSQRDSTLVVVIEDNGKGFDVKKAMASSLTESHLGLFGMYERVALIGGKLSIESEPKKGTAIFLKVPLNPMQEADYREDTVTFG